ncbi:hypothetical protein THARTR1_00453 [Trichoderma harzianum]|uniref:CENP-V/GFA domain-containing protein n=1 Tax=Trichoderma harzianum TaxID=5544 RepID=A0A2K0URM5_TRIHA|nr:hypothetical protein THARTR1_00453 [Trichoderma harzianum]
MTVTQDEPTRRTYRGNCHCGNFVYEVNLPELRSVVECDCSFCSRTGNLYVLTDEESNFRIVKGTEEGLKSYTFGPGNKIHKVRKVVEWTMGIREDANSGTVLS